MDRSSDVELSRTAIDEFLGTGGTGVLALAEDDRPYAVPVSYGYDAPGDRLFFRLGRSSTSEKGSFLNGRQPARLVVYEYVDDVWTSVIATGELSAVDDDALTGEIATALRRGAPPLFEIWADDLSDATFRIYRLAVDSLSGRRTDPAP